MRQRGLAVRIFRILVGGWFSVFAVAATASATTIDLTTGGSGSGTGALGGNFLASWVDQTSISAVDPFLRLQNGGNEQGYNTSIGTPLDDKPGAFTRPLTLSEIPIVNLGGVDYRQFLLDINEDRGADDELLSLNQIQIFQSSGDQSYASLSAATVASQAVIGFAAPANEIFRMNNANGNLEIRLNSSLNTGNGSGDMFLYVPDADFNPAFSNIILYSQFGMPSGFASSSAGFEEWSVVKPQVGTTAAAEAPVPEPASLLLLGTGLGLIARRARRRKSA